MIEQSKRPLILIGNGVKLSKTTQLIKNFIKKNNLPYACTWGITDLFDSNDMLNAGSFGVAASRYGNFTLQQSDLLLCLGMRLSAQIVGGDPKKFSPNS